MASNGSGKGVHVDVSPVESAFETKNDAASDAHESSIDFNPFSNPDVKQYYTDLYERSQYECRHVFDADLTWTPAEEKRLVRKIDRRVCLWATVMFVSLQVDRSNILHAVSGTLLHDLKLNTNDFNQGETLFRVAFLLAELPSQLLSKRLGPDCWIPMQISLWSIVAMGQAAVNRKATYLLCRTLLGFLEGGFIPEIIIWLSYFYKSRELPIRLSVFWSAFPFTTIVSSFCAFGIFHLEGYRGIAGWRWLFLLEGLGTLLIGLASFFMMPASAAQTKTWFRPKGWFTSRELSIVVNRVLRDDPRKGDMHNRQAITPRRLWEACKDYDLWPIYLIGFIAFIPAQPPTIYLTQMLRILGFSTLHTNLLTIPAALLSMITLLAITWTSEKLNQRALVAIAQPIWLLPCFIAVCTWSGFFRERWNTYALIVVLLGFPYCHAINVGWISRNSNSVGSRGVSAALYNMCAQLGSIVAVNIYRDDDRPLYRRGNRILLILNVVTIILFLFSKAYYVRRNKSREQKWNAMTPKDKKDYLWSTKDTGSRRLDFRFSH